MLSDEHPDEYASMNNLAVLRTKEKVYKEAKTLFKEALEGRRSPAKVASIFFKGEV